MAQARTEFAAALNQIASEKGVDVVVVLDAIKVAALAAYKKDLTLRDESVPDDFEEYTSEVDSVTGEISIFHNGKNVTPPGFARIAASIARQVILQKLNEAEKGAIMSEYADKVGTIISGVIQRQEGNTYFVDLGRAEGIMPPSEQTHGEYYHQNQRLKFYIKEIREAGRGPEVILSRNEANLVKCLFALEVPEIQTGSVEIKAIAREAGGRTKLAAVSTQDGVDPVGSLVGQKGVRVQAVMQELGDEKIDIVTYSDDPARFIAAALSPAKEIKVALNELERVATVSIPSSQLSLAIGKGGQNVRLAAKLTGWKIDIEGIEEPSTLETTEGKPEAAIEVGTHEQEKQAEELAGVQQVTELPAEETSAKEEMNEATDPSQTISEAVVEAVEENITQAEQDEYQDSQLQEEPAADPTAAVVAEADIAEEDQKEHYAEKKEVELGSMGEQLNDEKTQAGDLIGDREPLNEETAPVDTTETPHVKEEVQENEK